MVPSLQFIYKRLLEEISLDHFRFLYHQFNLADRLTGLAGPRGVGKTTLLLQVIKTKLAHRRDVFYFSADHIYFDKVSLYEFIEELYLSDGIRFFFIDEIHQYKNWSQEIKNIYDGFPDVHIIFSEGVAKGSEGSRFVSRSGPVRDEYDRSTAGTKIDPSEPFATPSSGSSSLELVKGSYDLSRRAKMYYLSGMSFREYLTMETGRQLDIIPFSDLMANHQHYDSMLVNVPRIKGHFNDYLRQGFYPFYRDNPLSYHQKLLEVIDKTISRCGQFL